MDIKTAAKKLLQSLTRLEKTDSLGAVARRNARSDFMHAMRALRAAADATYPPMRDGIKRSRLSTRQRYNRLRKSGYSPIDAQGRDVTGMLAEVGIKPRPDPDYPGEYWVPAWVNAIVCAGAGHDQTVNWLRRMKKPSERQQVSVEIDIYSAVAEAGLSSKMQRAAVARCKHDRDFLVAIRTVALIGVEEVKQTIESTCVKDAEEEKA